MIIMSRDDIKENIVKQNLDIRVTGNGRWIDQKCTPDILCVVADFIINYLYHEIEDIHYKFTVKEIWYSEKPNKIIKKIFKKPALNKKTAKNEYDKFFGQPIKLFTSAGILKEYPRQGPYGANLYKVKNLNLLEFISYREMNALDFLIVYIEHTLIKSGLYKYFDNFFKLQNKDSYQKLKLNFSRFIKEHTKIKKDYEPNRMFPKVLNPLSFDKNLKGSKNGRISKNIITYDMLMYNRDNFRDIYMEKPKNMTREEYIIKENIYINEDLTEYQINKAKNIVRKYNNEYRGGKSEYYEESEKDNLATQIHHIFPKSDYIEISAYIENLIALTPNQHFLKAHKYNNTHYICEDYQHLLLLAKMKTIIENLKTDKVIYSIERFKYVLSVGLRDKNFLYIDNDYNTIKNNIDKKYM